MTEVTSFPFHVNRFMDSEAVEAMTAEEVGQYVLLLCQSWRLGRECTLPVDPVALSRYTRGPVSEKVLAKFPVIDYPPSQRRRNDVLYREWVATKKSLTNANSPCYTECSGTRTKLSTNSKASNLVLSPNTKTDSSNTESISAAFSFKNLASHYFRKFGRHLGNNAWNRGDYEKACSRFPEQTVLDAFDAWADDNQWVREWIKGKPTSGLKQFWDSLETIIENKEIATTDRTEAAISHARMEEAVKKQAEAERKRIKEQYDAEQAERARALAVKDKWL